MAVVAAVIPPSIATMVHLNALVISDLRSDFRLARSAFSSARSVFVA